MSRVVFVVLVLFVLWRLLSSFGRRVARQGHGADSFSRFSPQERARRRAAPPEPLVSCGVCGTYIPAGRALPAVGGTLVCSDACRGKLSAEHS